MLRNAVVTSTPPWLRRTLSHAARAVHANLVEPAVRRRLRDSGPGLWSRLARAAAEAPTRLRLAWRILVHGPDLPNVDAGLADDGEATHPPRASSATITSAAPDRETPRTKQTLTGPAVGVGTGRTNLAALGGKDIFAKCRQFVAADAARSLGIYPYFRPLEQNDGPEAVLDGRRVLMLGSNNYLGLTADPRVAEAARKALERYGTSMTGSRLINGSTQLHEELEARLARFLGRESAMVFTTGYQSNLATLSALLTNKRTVAVLDRSVHASIYDGAKLGQALGARLLRYRHNDPDSLDQTLSTLNDDEGAIVVTDGVFSAGGDLAPLDRLNAVARRHGARLLVDDAHGLGVLGRGGRGTAHHFGVENDVDLLSGTFSKSLASIGGWLAGERRVLDYVRHFAPSFLFAAAAPPSTVAAAITALEILETEPWRVDKLRDNHEYMRRELKALGFDIGDSASAIIPIYVRDDDKTIAFWNSLLQERGVYTNPFISPGVLPRNAMIRTSYMATHERSHLDRALEALRAVGRQHGLI